jgi:lipopolysaccharide transport system ATP-binding protein
MNAAMMGSRARRPRTRFQQILDFSELHDFIDAPVRTYSSGMVARLAFSVAVAADPDVLIIDEILGGRRHAFQRKCVDKIWDYKARGKTMFFCSHSLYDVRQICEQAIWLREGRVHMMADAVMVTNEYATWESHLRDKPDQSGYEKLPAAVRSTRTTRPTTTCILASWVRSSSIRPPDSRGTTSRPATRSRVRVHVRNSKTPEKLAMAIGAMRSEGTLCFAHSTQFDGVRLDAPEFVVTLTLGNLCLLSGEFNLPIWLFDERGVHRFHERPVDQKLVVQNRTKDLGLFLQNHQWQVDRVPGSVFK